MNNILLGTSKVRGVDRLTIEIKTRDLYPNSFELNFSEFHSRISDDLIGLKSEVLKILRDAGLICSEVEKYIPSDVDRPIGGCLMHYLTKTIEVGHTECREGLELPEVMKAVKHELAYALEFRYLGSIREDLADFDNLMKKYGLKIQTRTDMEKSMNQ